MRSNDHVAVIMSVYKNDRCDHFKLAVESILKQSYKDITLFICQDGEVPSDIRHYLEILELDTFKVFVYKSDVNNGLAKSLNLLIDRVIESDKYNFIARMDADDISYENRIQSQVAFLKDHKSVDVIGTACEEFGSKFALSIKKLPTIHNELLDYSITRCPFIHPTVMFRTSIFVQGIRYPSNTQLTEDMALWFELLSKGFIFSNLTVPLLKYRIDLNTLKRRRGFKKAISEILIRTKYMFKLRRVTYRNSLLLIAKFLFHISPYFVMHYLYKNKR